MSLLQRAREHYARQRAVSVAAVLAARRQVQAQPADSFGLARVVANYQLASATLAGRSMAAEAGRDPVTDPVAFIGRTTGGVTLLDPAQTLLDDLAARLEAEASTLAVDMLARVDRFVASEVAEAGRAAAGVEIAAEPLWTNYVRVLNPPSCSRCAILAGRIYRDNEGFLRHPLCDCVHWPVESWEQAHDEGLVFSAKDAFAKGQIRGLSQDDARAISDGADIAAVVNAAQGMYTGSIFGRDGIKVTSAGTTKRSAWRKANPDRKVRLRPESIYDLAKDRDDELRLLKLYGYIKDDARVAAGPRASTGGGSGGRKDPPAPKQVEPADDGPLAAAADRVMAAAVRAEPEATAHVRAATEGRGQLERLETRFKDRKSVLRKLARDGDSATKVARQARRFNDALRYTVVLEDETYWADARVLAQVLATRGYSVGQEPLQWAPVGYRGINLKVTAPDGTRYEVQLHTRASLDAAESSHSLYEKQRLYPAGSTRFVQLADEMDAIFARVPFPPGHPEVP